jgi:hypothetical protein
MDSLSHSHIYFLAQREKFPHLGLTRIICQVTGERNKAAGGKKVKSNRKTEVLLNYLISHLRPSFLFPTPINYFQISVDPNDL